MNLDPAEKAAPGPACSVPAGLQEHGLWGHFTTRSSAAVAPVDLGRPPGLHSVV